LWRILNRHICLLRLDHLEVFWIGLGKNALSIQSNDVAVESLPLNSELFLNDEDIGGQKRIVH